MKLYIKKVLLFIFIGFSIIEILSRIFIDPLYFYKTNHFGHTSGLISNTAGIFQDIKKAFSKNKLPKVNYVFIGSSRMWCAIDASIFCNSSDSVVSINAADGGTTPAIEYFALEKAFINNKSSFSNTTFVFEYPRDLMYFKDSTDFCFQVFEGSPQKILPYLSLKQLADFLLDSKNSYHTKMDVLLSRISSAYRTYPFIKVYKSKFINKIILQLQNKKEKRLLAGGGGIRQEFTKDFKTKILQGFINSKKEFINYGTFSKSDLDESMIDKLLKLIKKHNGKVLFLNIPLHSANANIYQNEIVQDNLLTFKKWSQKRNIAIVEADDFLYSDEDFPDNLHLNRNLRKDYSRLVLDEIKKIK